MIQYGTPSVARAFASVLARRAPPSLAPALAGAGHSLFTASSACVGPYACPMGPVMPSPLSM